MSNLSRTFLVLSITALLCACSSTPITATSDFDDSYDFSGVKTFTVLPIDRTSAAEKLISDMQVQRIDEALIAELEARGPRAMMPICSCPGTW